MMMPVKGNRYYVDYEKWTPKIWTCICPGLEYSVMERKVFFSKQQRIVSNRSLLKVCE